MQLRYGVIDSALYYGRFLGVWLNKLSNYVRIKFQMTMDSKDLQFINSNTGLIKTGWLTFQEDEKEEIFKELHICDWESILTNEELREIMLNPTINGLQKIIDINDETYFDRVRIVLHVLITDGEDVSSRVKNIVDTRYKELVRKQRKSSIILSEKDTAIPNNKVKELENQNAELQSQLDEMKAMMAQLMEMQKQNTTVVTEEKSITTTASSTTKKPVGRPPKNK